MRGGGDHLWGKHMNLDYFVCVCSTCKRARRCCRHIKMQFFFHSRYSLSQWWCCCCCCYHFRYCVHMRFLCKVIIIITLVVAVWVGRTREANVAHSRFVISKGLWRQKKNIYVREGKYFGVICAAKL